MQFHFNNFPILTITIISWNTEDLLRNCLTSLLNNNIQKFAVIHVIDNDSSDNSVEMVRREFPEVKLSVNDRNIGFAAANNQSWKEAKSNYWMLLNSDTIVKPQAIENLIDFMNAIPKAGMASAKLISPDGTIQHCAQREQGIFNTLLEFSRLHKILPQRMRENILLSTYFGYDRPQKLDWAWGTALIVRREAIEQAGALSDEFFMYGEDMEWSLRMRKFGWEIWFCPNAEIIHYGGQSTQQAWDNEKKQSVILDNCYRALEIHRGKLYVKILQAVTLCVSWINYFVSKISRRDLLAKHYHAAANYHLKKLKGNV